MRKALLCSILIAAVLASAFAADIKSDLGKPFKDFTIRTVDGGTFRLSEQLKTHDLVFVNNWATWCGWCEVEFPALQSAWDKYSDRVAVIAVTPDPNDTDEDIRAYAEEKGLHLAMARDDERLFTKYSSAGLPTSFIIDRFGNMAWIHAGSIPSPALFEKIFTYFFRENYPTTKILENFRTLGIEKLPRFSSEELSKAACLKGSGIVFRNSEDANVLPFAVFSQNGRTGLVSSNADFPGTVSAVLADVTVPIGGVLTFDYEINGASGQNHTFFELSVDGNPVKRVGSMRDRTSYAISLPTGRHEIAFSFCNNHSYEGDCYVRISNVAVKSGYSARQALSKMPSVPVADDFAIEFLSGEIQKINFAGDSSILENIFGTGMEYIIINSDKVNARITITEAMDPDMVYTLSTFDTPETLSEFRTDGKGYTVTLETEEGIGAFVAVSCAQVYVTDSTAGYVYFADEQTARALFEAVRYYDPDFKWEIVPFTDSSVSSADNVVGETQSTYRVRFTDQYGSPVAGVAVNFCSDTTCRPVFSGSDGYAVYTGEPYNYHMQIIKVPKGYSFDRNAEYYTERKSSEYTLTVTKN